VAERWARTNKGLTGDKLKKALEQQGWDASVKSLVAVPAVASRMTTFNPDQTWTKVPAKELVPR
jgi:hypothetical protein